MKHMSMQVKNTLQDIVKYLRKMKHSMLSYYLLIKRIPLAIMGQFALLGPPKKDFGMDNFLYWANIAHHLF